MSVEKTLHVQVIYIQGHFFHGVAGEEQWDKGEQGEKKTGIHSILVQNAMLFGQKQPPLTTLQLWIHLNVQ